MGVINIVHTLAVSYCRYTLLPRPLALACSIVYVLSASGPSVGYGEAAFTVTVAVGPAARTGRCH